MLIVGVLAFFAANQQHWMLVRETASRQGGTAIWAVVMPDSGRVEPQDSAVGRPDYRRVLDFDSISSPADLLLYARPGLQAVVRINGLPYDTLHIMDRWGTFIRVPELPRGGHRLSIRANELSPRGTQSQWSEGLELLVYSDDGEGTTPRFLTAIRSPQDAAGGGSLWVTGYGTPGAPPYVVTVPEVTEPTQPDLRGDGTFFAQVPIPEDGQVSLKLMSRESDPATDSILVVRGRPEFASRLGRAITIVGRPDSTIEVSARLRFPADHPWARRTEVSAAGAAAIFDAFAGAEVNDEEMTIVGLSRDSAQMEVLLSATLGSKHQYGLLRGPWATLRINQGVGGRIPGLLDLPSDTLLVVRPEWGVFVPGALGAPGWSITRGDTVLWAGSHIRAAPPTPRRLARTGRVLTLGLPIEDPLAYRQTTGSAAVDSLIDQARQLEWTFFRWSGRWMEALLLLVPFGLLLSMIRPGRDRAVTEVRAALIALLLVQIIVLLPFFANDGVAVVGRILERISPYLSPPAIELMGYPLVALAVLIGPVYARLRGERVWSPTDGPRRRIAVPAALLLIALTAGIIGSMALLRAEDLEVPYGVQVIFTADLLGLMVVSALGTAASLGLLCHALRFSVRPAVIGVAALATALTPVLPLAARAAERRVRSAVFDGGLEALFVNLPWEWGRIVQLVLALLVPGLLLAQIGRICLESVRPGTWEAWSRWARAGAVAGMAILFAPLGELVREGRWTWIANPAGYSYWDPVSLLSAVIPFATMVPLSSYLYRKAPRRGYDLDRELIAVATVGFVFYLAGRTTSLVFVPVPLLLAWLLFSRWVLDPSPPPAPESKDRFSAAVSKFLGHRRIERLRPSRAKAFEKQYAAASITWDELQENLRGLDAEAAAVRARMETALAATPLLAYGSEDSARGNARVALKAGMALALPLLVLEIINSLGRPGSQFVSIAPVGLLVSTLQIVGIWLLLAFLFGFLFHRIRGENGLQKSAVFLIAVLVPGLAYRLLEMQTAFGADYLRQVFPPITFLLLVALVAFDIRSLRGAGLAPRHLPDFYGLPALFAYASAIAVAVSAGQTLAPLTKLISGFVSLVTGGAGG